MSAATGTLAFPACALLSSPLVLLLSVDVPADASMTLSSLPLQFCIEHLVLSVEYWI
jgi:hypothetical protein